MEKKLNEDLQQLILETSKKAFKKAISQYGADSLCAFALYSDAGAMTVLPSINTKSHLENRVKDYPDDAEYYRWSTSEWEHEAIYEDDFLPISEKLRSELKNLKSDRDFDKFKKKLYGICIEVLLTLKGENLFGDSLVLFAVPDDEDDDRDIKWVKTLNSPKLASEFKLWLSEQ